MVISRSPVNAAPAVPAPAPAPAPIAAPLPPPASAPISPPTTAPPPAPIAVLLPRPLPDSVTAVVSSEYLSPFTVMESRVTPSSAFPLNLPADLATVTVPRAFAPEGMTTFSPTVTGAASEASKWSPSLLVFELTDWSTVTEMGVPDGTTSGFGANTGGAGRCSLGAEFAAEGESGAPGPAGVADVEDVEGDWLQPNIPTRPAIMAIRTSDLFCMHILLLI